MLNIVTVVGARPQFVKAAVISRLIRSRRYGDFIEEYLVHTGQHYDANLSGIFFEEMRIPHPDINLGLGSGTHAQMTGQMLMGIEGILAARRPDLVLVYGDTDTTLAGALAASKLQVPLAHVEAGLRSYCKKMPEEQNRIVTDHVSAFLFCPTETAIGNLRKEGMVSAPRAGWPTSDAPLVRNVGDVMLDALEFYGTIVRARPVAESIGHRLRIKEPFRLLTLHRAENTDNGERLRSIFDALNATHDLEIVFPVHPRTRRSLAEHGIAIGPHIRPIDPVGYFDMLELEQQCDMVVTDSGGVQKEAFFFGKPCVTLRDQTEWVETVESGWNTLAGADSDRIAGALGERTVPAERENLFGDADAGSKILDLILSSSRGP